MSNKPDMPEQPENSANSPDSDIDDLWGSALSEQQATESANAVDSASEPAQDALFETLVPKPLSSESKDINLILDIPVKMTVELGRTKLTIKELLNLTQGSVISLEGLAGEPLDILINGYLIAQGEVVVVGDKYGVRITDIITPSERMRRLSH